MAERLTARERIKRRPEFEATYAGGTRLHSRSFTMFVAMNDGDRARIGVAATRKLGGAVVRNRAKRLVRELFRRHKPSTALDVIIVARREMLDAPFASLEAEYRAVLDRGSQRCLHAARRPRRDGGARPADGV